MVKKVDSDDDEEEEEDDEGNVANQDGQQPQKKKARKGGTDKEEEKMAKWFNKGAFHIDKEEAANIMIETVQKDLVTAKNKLQKLLEETLV